MLPPRWRKKESEMTPEELAERKRSVEGAIAVFKFMDENGIEDPWEGAARYFNLPVVWGNKSGGFVKLSNTQSEEQKPSTQSSKPQSEKGEKPER